MLNLQIDLETQYCHIDDFFKAFKVDWDQHLLGSGNSPRGPDPKLSTSEMMMIVILFHQSNFRTFKHFYSFVEIYLRGEFPKLVSYNRFVYLKRTIFVPLFAYLLSLMGLCTGISFIDSTSISVCKNKRIKRNKVFRGMARRGKTTTGWFYGFKLHLIINDQGELLAFQVTPGNVSDVSVADSLSKNLFGKLFGDKGYISTDLGKKLLDRGLELFTTVRSNMKQKLMAFQDKILLRKRSIIETVNDQLKNISQIEHSRHRSSGNFLINLFSGLIAYCHQPKKPSLNLGPQFEDQLIAV